MRRTIRLVLVGVYAILALAGCGGAGTLGLSNSAFVGTYASDVTRSTTSRLVVNVDSDNVVTASLIDENNPIGGWFGQGKVDSQGNVAVIAANPTDLTTVTIDGSVLTGSFVGTVTGATGIGTITAQKLSSGGIQLTGTYTGTGPDKPVGGPQGTTTVTITVVGHQATVTGAASDGTTFTFTGIQETNGLIQVSGTVYPGSGKPESVVVNGVIAPSNDGATVYGVVVVRDASTSLVIRIDSFVIHKQ